MRAAPLAPPSSGAGRGARDAPRNTLSGELSPTPAYWNPSAAHVVGNSSPSGPCEAVALTTAAVTAVLAGKGGAEAGKRARTPESVVDPGGARETGGTSSIKAQSAAPAESRVKTCVKLAGSNGRRSNVMVELSAERIPVRLFLSSPPPQSKHSHRWVASV